MTDSSSRSTGTGGEHQGASSHVPRVPKGRVARLVYSYLRGIFPRTERPKQIAAAIREKPGTVRKTLQRLKADGVVVDVKASGFYRLWMDPAILKFAERPEPCVHGIQIRALVPRNGGSGVPRGARQARLSGASDRGWRVEESNGSAAMTEWVMGRAVQLQAFPTGTLLVNVSATRSPVRFADWKEFAAELRGLCKGYGVDLDAPTAQLVNVEFNADWRQFFLGDVKRLKLSSVSRAWGQLYQKHADALRMELRVAPKEMTLREAGEVIVSLVEAQAHPLREAFEGARGPEDSHAEAWSSSGEHRAGTAEARDGWEVAYQ